MIKRTEQFLDINPVDEKGKKIEQTEVGNSIDTNNQRIFGVVEDEETVVLMLRKENFDFLMSEKTQNTRIFGLVDIMLRFIKINDSAVVKNTGKIIKTLLNEVKEDNKNSQIKDILVEVYRLLITRIVDTYSKTTDMEEFLEYNQKLNDLKECGLKLKEIFPQIKQFQEQQLEKLNKQIFNNFLRQSFLEFKEKEVLDEVLNNLDSCNKNYFNNPFTEKLRLLVQIDHLLFNNNSLLSKKAKNAISRFFYDVMNQQQVVQEFYKTSYFDEMHFIARKISFFRIIRNDFKNLPISIYLKRAYIFAVRKNNAIDNFNSKIKEINDIIDGVTEGYRGDGDLRILAKKSSDIINMMRFIYPKKEAELRSLNDKINEKIEETEYRQSSESITLIQATYKLMEEVSLTNAQKFKKSADEAIGLKNKKLTKDAKELIIDTANEIVKKLGKKTILLHEYFYYEKIIKNIYHNLYFYLDIIGFKKNKKYLVEYINILNIDDTLKEEFLEKARRSQDITYGQIGNSDDQKKTIKLINENNKVLDYSFEERLQIILDLQQVLFFKQSDLNKYEKEGVYKIILECFSKCLNSFQKEFQETLVKYETSGEKIFIRLEYEKKWLSLKKCRDIFDFSEIINNKTLSPLIQELDNSFNNTRPWENDLSNNDEINVNIKKGLYILSFNNDVKPSYELTIIIEKTAEWLELEKQKDILNKEYKKFINKMSESLKVIKDKEHQSF